MENTKVNPIQQRIAGGMSILEAVFTDATCGEACWEAREDVCRCSCGGKNHGCMRIDGGSGVKPARTSKIDGYRYELKAVGARWSDANDLCKAVGPKSEEKYTASRYNDATGQFEPHEGVYTYHWSVTDKGAPARLKTASESQMKWPELAAYEHCRNRPYLLWVRVTE